jgi:hypothetical protein
MSNNYWDDEDDELDTDQNLGGDDLVKKLRKAKRADEKRIKELTEQLEGLTKVQRERTVKEVLEQKGVNPKAARIILKDLDDVNEETVMNWLDDNGDLFGYTRDEQEQRITEVDRATLRQQDIITQNAGTPSRAEDLEARLGGEFNSQEELIAFLRSQ